MAAFGPSPLIWTPPSPDPAQMDVAEHLDGHRAELTGYCARLLGSRIEAEDAVQETLVRAWRAFDRFEGRSALRTWLYSIASNVCFDHLNGRARAADPVDLGPGSPSEASARVASAAEPGVAAAADPADVAVSRDEVRVAFAVALCRLPPRQRAALFLREVLRWRAKEAAEFLGVTVVSVNSALQRARATLAGRRGGDTDGPGQLDNADQARVAGFVDAFARDDFDAVANVLRDDVVRQAA